MEPSRKPNSDILADHIREGKLFKPPLASLPLDETSWVNQTLPELFWVALVQRTCGLARGVDLCLGLAEAALQAKSSTSNVSWFAAVRSYASLTEAEWRNVRSVLEESGKLTDLARALAPLVHFYPECPLAPLFTEPPRHLSNRDVRLNDLKTLLESLYNKQERAAILVQATAVYIALVTGKVLLAENMSIGNLEAVKNFPRTEESQMVAASVRSMCNALIGIPHPEEDPGWAQYFWARGFDLEPCEYELPYKL